MRGRIMRQGALPEQGTDPPSRIHNLWAWLDADGPWGPRRSTRRPESHGDRTNTPGGRPNI